MSAAFWFDPVTFDESEPMADRLTGAIAEVEQYYGDMHWDIAGPLLKEKFGRL